MNINYSVKQMGKKHPLIGKNTIEIEDIGLQPTLKKLIEAVVTQQVEAFNARKSEKNLIKYLQKSEIDTQKESGKIGFNDSYNDTKADVNAAIDNALLAFEDGIYCVFVDEEQVEKLEEQIQITESSTLYFIRLTFLAGSIW
ncbi:MAG: hypothetical protein CMO01_23025 [Thalassobius sp.]|nr:hypothetical protein [Thalassovita sp.]